MRTLANILILVASYGTFLPLAFGASAPLGEGLRLKNESPCAECVSGKKFVIEVKGADGKTFDVSPSDATSRLDLARTYKARAIVVGALPYGGNVATIIDLAAKEVSDIVYGYDMTMSPDSRYLVYRQYYPRGAPPSFRKSIVRLYDLAQTATENRAKGVALKDPEQAGALIYPKLGDTQSRTTESGVAEFSLQNGVVWQPDRLALTVPTKDEAWALLVISLAHLADVSCTVPVLPMSGPSPGMKIAVKSLSRTQAHYVIEIFENAGISGTIAVNPNVACPSLPPEKND